MLNSLNLSDKTYEELLAEAVAQIPLYSSEWTNFNISDPGITLLQNLTAFQLLQQEAIDTVPEEVLRKLLKLVGYTGRENRAAAVLVQAPADGGPLLPEGTRLWSGTIPFETEQTIALNPWGLAAVYVGSEVGEHEVTRLLDPATETTAYPFGRQPQSGNRLTCVLSGVPEVGEPLRLWAQVAEEELRTPFDDAAQIPDFAKVRWQYWTENGWEDAKAEDETSGFLRSGCITLRLEGALPAQRKDAPIQGCALRCLLEKADYDRAPRLRMLAAHLFPMVQKETRVRCCTFGGAETAEIYGDGILLETTEVFCREKVNGPYRRYREQTVEGIPGRFYRTERRDGSMVLRFDPAFGYVPCGDADAVRVVCYDGEMIHHRLLGPVYGYDRQVIPLEQVSDVLTESLLVAVKGEEDGEDAYWFAAPEEKGPNGFSYHLRSKEAELVIDEPAGGGVSLLLASCAVTQGTGGNLRACSLLEQRGGYDGTEVERRYFCPAPGRGGMSYESVEEVRLRFSAGMRQPTAAVRPEDCEMLVRCTPGLCIHKVKAIPDTELGQLRLVVKPHTEEALPKLSPAYLHQLQSYLEPRRMLTTRLVLCQPRYAPISVNAVLYVRGMVSHAEAAVEKLLRELLDHVNGPHDFGGWVRFHEVYHALSALPFVEAVDALSLYPESRDAVLLGSDVRLDEDSLCYPGSIRLTIHEQGR